MSEREALTPKRPEAPPSSSIPEVSKALYYDSTQSPTAVGFILYISCFCFDFKSNSGQTDILVSW